MITNVIGIMNITPDSFYDGGALFKDKPDMGAIMRMAENMIAEGASIIDVGGESTRPGAEPVGTEEELERVIPVIEQIKSKFNICVSVDTYKSAVASEAVKKGAEIINDISMLSEKDGMTDILLKNQDVKYVLTHNKEGYKKLIFDLKNKARQLISSGVDPQRLILDPGIGFNKTYEQNIREIRKLSELCKLGFPVLLGVSNKSVIGDTLNLPVEDRLEGTLALSAIAVQTGVKYIRVHDVKANVRAIKMVEKVIYDE